MWFRCVFDRGFGMFFVVLVCFGFGYGGGFSRCLRVCFLFFFLRILSALLGRFWLTFLVFIVCFLNVLAVVLVGCGGDFVCFFRFM